MKGVHEKESVMGWCAARNHLFWHHLASLVMPDSGPRNGFFDLPHAIVLSTANVRCYCELRSRMTRHGWSLSATAELYKIVMNVSRRFYNNRPRCLSWMRRPTGDQEIAGSTPAEVGNILSWR